jgi:hypothetical protein
MWPSKLPENKVPDPEVKPLEKTAAELIAEALNPFIEGQRQFQTNLNERLQKLEEQTAKPPAREPDPGQPVSVLDDENAAFAQRMTPLYARQLELESRIVKTDIKAEYVAAGYGDLWAKFAKDIDETVDKSPLVTAEGKPFRGDPQYIRNVVDMIMGRAARNAGMRFDGKDKGFFLESASSGPELGKGPEADGMSEAQRRLLTKMKVPLDQAKDVIKKLHFVS